MTEIEAFFDWANKFEEGEIQHPKNISVGELVWQAACKYQREKDAEICRKRYMGDNNREDMEARRCAEAILNQNEPDQA